MRTLIASSVLTVALLSLPTMAEAQTGAYCLKSKSGAARCAYQTMAQCERAKKTGDQCLSRAETTGAAPGSTQPMGRSKSPSQSPSR